MEIRVCALADLPEGRGMRVEIGDVEVAVFRIEEDVYAIGDRCSHAEASLAEGDLVGTGVECPRHGSEFDLRTGRPGSLPAIAPVPVYGTEVRDGDVYLTLEHAS